MREVPASDNGGRKRTTGTPRPGTLWCRGRSPGSRVAAPVRPSRSDRFS